MKEVREALLRAMRATIVMLAFLALASVAIAWGAGGLDAAWAALAGVGAAAFVGLSTQAVMVLCTRSSAAILPVMVLGSFVVKVVILVLVVLAIRALDLPKEAFASPLTIGVIATIIIDTIVLMKARVPYATTGRAGEQG